MNEEDLSPAAKKELKKRTPSTDEGGNWFEAYDNMLKGLADEEISDVKQGVEEDIDVWRKRRDKNAVAVELQAYAKAFLGPDISAAVAKIPTGDFFKWLMPKVGREVALKRFMEFLRHEARESSKSFFGVSSDDEEKRREWIEVQAQARFDTLDHPDVPMSKETAYNIGKNYRAWWKTQDDGNNLSEENRTKKMEVFARMEKMTALLPRNNRANEGLTSIEWERKAFLVLDVKSTTFRRDRDELVRRGEVVVSNGKYRAPKKPPEKK